MTPVPRTAVPAAQHAWGTPPVSERGAVAGAIAATGLGTLGLLGWLTPWPGLATVDPASPPMAPRTALAVVFLGGALILEARRRSPLFTTVVYLLVLSLASVQLVSSIAVGVPAARVSPWTALGVALASLSVAFTSQARRHRVLGAAGASLALGVCLLGSLILLGYLFNAPLLYGSAVLPIPFSTTLAIACLGLAVVGLAPRDSVPLRPFTGCSIRATLLRAFLPVTPAILIVEGLFDRIQGLNPALDAAVAALTSTVVVAIVVSYVARGVGRDLERSRRDADRLAAIVQCSADAIYAKSLDGTIVAWNPGAERLFGYSQAEALGRSAKMLVPPGTGDEWAGILERVTHEGRLEHREADRERKDGSHVLVALTESPLRDAVGRVVGVSVIARNVSEQSRAATALHASETKMSALFASNVVGIVFGDAHGVLDANDKFLDMVGYTRADLASGLKFKALTAPEFQHLDAAGAAEAQRWGACTPYEKEYIRKDGTRLWVLVGYVFLEPERQQSVAFVLDIDARKQAEEEYRSLFESNPHAMWVFDVETLSFLAVNDAAVRLYGFSRDEFLTMTIKDIRPVEEIPALIAYLATIPDSMSLPATQIRHRKKDGTLLEVRGASNPIEFRGKRARLVLVDDVSETKQLEAQLLQAQKMDAIGRLAGGVAHDFNNSLGVILGYTELLMRQASEAQRSKLEQIVKATQRSSTLTHQLLAFSRKQVVDPKVLDLNALLSNLEKMLVRLIGEDIDLAIVPGVDLGQVKADPGQLDQVVMNLCVNARDAMPGGGLLRIETANVELDASHAFGLEPMTPGRYVVLAVTDAGCGIEKEILSKIFEPFFTTKEQGKGTGLGLAMVYGIAKQAEGYVWVRSEVGRGTTFKIYLPRIDEPITPAAREAPMPARGWETVLLVEDEEPLREITREILQEHGYRVIGAAGAHEALHIAQHHPEPIHLLVTDVVMPGMNGRALAKSLVATHPALRVLYMSGYTDDVIAHSGLVESGARLLEKPFTALALLQRMRQTLGERGTGENA